VGLCFVQLCWSWSAWNALSTLDSQMLLHCKVFDLFSLFSFYGAPESVVHAIYTINQYDKSEKQESCMKRGLHGNPPVPKFHIAPITMPIKWFGLLGFLCFPFCECLPLSSVLLVWWSFCGCILSHSTQLVRCPFLSYIKPLYFVQKLTDDYMKKVDTIFKQKEKVNDKLFDSGCFIHW